MSQSVNIFANSAARVFAALLIGVFFSAQPCFSLENPAKNGCSYHAPDMQTHVFVQSAKASALKHIPQTIALGNPPQISVYLLAGFKTESTVSCVLPFTSLYTFAKFSTSTFF